jgi:fibronectin-binding autotransporter adhesin
MPHRLSNALITTTALIACVAIGGSRSVHGQTAQTWDGAGNGTSWSTNNGTPRRNFSGESWTQGNNAIFGTAFPSTSLTLDESITANSLTFSTGTTFSIGGPQSLTITATTGGLGIVRTATTTGTQTLSMNSLVLGSGQTWQINGAGRLIVSATVSGTSALTKTGTGTLELAGANTHTGTTTLSAGTLVVANAAALQNSSVFLGSGTLAFSTITSATFGALGGTANLALSNTTGGAVALTVGGRNVDTTLSGTLSGGGSLTKVGSGVLTLTATNSYSGATTINAGAINVGNSSALGTSSSVTVASGAALQVQGGVVISRPLTISGSGLASDGVLRSISGANTWSGAITLGSGVGIAVDSGTLTIATGGIQGSSQPITKTGAGTLRFTGNASQNYTGAITIASGTVALGQSNALGSAASFVVNGSNSTLDVGTFGAQVTGSFVLANGSIVGAGTITKNNVDYDLRNGTVSAVLGGNASLLKTTSGTVTLSRTNVYTGSTSVTGGVLAFAASTVLPDTTALTVTNAELAIGQFSDAITSLQTGASGTATLSYTVTSGSAGSLTTTGNVVFGSGSNVLAFSNVNSGTAGRYTVLTYGGSVTGTYAATGLAGTNYTLQGGTAGGVSIFLQRKAEIGAIVPTFAGTNAIIRGGTAPFTFTVRNATPTGGANLTITAATAGTNVVGTVNTGTINLAPQATSGGLSGFSFTSNTTGTQTGLFTLTSPDAVLTTGTGIVSVSVFDNASPTLTSGTLAIVPQHVGYAAAATGSIAAGNAAGFRVAMNGTGTTSGPFGVSGLANVAAGASGFITGTFATGQAPGTYTQSVSYRFSDASTLPGVSANVGTANLLLSAQVYTGSSTWIRTTSGTHSWGTLTGTGANAFGQNWGTNQGSPGLDAAFTRTDTATFGTALTGGTAVVLLNGANPSLKSITFNNAAGSYDLDIGTGGSGRIILAGSGTTAGVLDVQAGRHEIHTELQLGSNLQVSVAAGSGLTLHAAVSGSAFGLTKSGAGLLTMRGNDVYSGGTLIAGGTLAIGSAGALGSGTVTLSNGSTLNLQGFAITNQIDSTGGFVINPASNVVTISGPTVVSGTSITGVYTITPTGDGTFTGPLGDPAGLLGGQVTVQSGGLLTTTGTITDYGSVLILAGGRGVFSAPVNGVITSSGTSTFAADIQSLADVLINGGVATFNGTTFGDVNVDVSGTNTGGATATFNGTIDRTAHVYASGTMNLYGSVTANADVKVEAGGLARLYGSGTFGQASMLVNGSFVLDRTADLTMATVFSGSGRLVKQGSWLLTLTGSSDYAGSVEVNAGKLSLNGHLGAATVTVANGATLSGAGVAGLTITGGGLIAPGNSPGILTAQALAPTSLTSFLFQFTGTGAPLWSSGTSSVNDVLRLTDASNPFASSLTASNIVNVLFDVATLAPGTTFQGGFYTDKSASFTGNIAAATYNYYVKGDGLGTDATFNGQGYYSLPTWAATNMPSYTNVLVSTRYAQADFAGGTVNGFTSEFVVVPEPAAPLAGVIGLAAAAWCLRRRAVRA